MSTTDTKTIKALSVHQPWSWALVHGQKRIENRTWRTNYRGPLIIHASKNRETCHLYGMGDWRKLIPDIRVLRDDEFGCLYGLVDLVDCIPFESLKNYSAMGESSDWLATQKPYAEGPWCWIIENPRSIQPVTYRGRQQLFDVPADLIEIVY